MGEISQAFLDGMQELYSLMFTNQIYLSLMDESTQTNIYKESKNKNYQDPIQLIGKVTNTVETNEEPLEDVKYSFVFTIPTKELIDNSLPHTPQEYDTLKKAKMTFEGVDYRINYVQPSTLIDGVYLMYKFYCEAVPMKSGGAY